MKHSNVDFCIILQQVVPTLIKEVYGSKLKMIYRIGVIVNTWKVNYDDKIVCLSDLREMLKLFKVVWKKTLTLIIDVGAKISARIYQENEKEIDYVTRMFNLEESKSTKWMWRLIWDDDIKQMKRKLIWIYSFTKDF